MFNIGLSELLIIFLIASLVLDPKDLPKIAVWLARQIKKLRSVISEIKSESGWNEFEKEIKNTETTINREIKQINTEIDIKPEIKNLSDEIESVTHEIK